MKVILKQDLPNVGEEGDIKEVADGYARNYLAPKGLAALYSKAALNELEKRRHVIEAKKEAKRKEALSWKEKIETLQPVFRVAAGEKGRLFGAITPALIVEELAKSGIMVERKKIEAPEMKNVGSYAIKIKLYGSETASLKITVESSEPKAHKKAAEPEGAQKAEEPAAAEEAESAPESREEEA